VLSNFLYVLFAASDSEKKLKAMTIPVDLVTEQHVTTTDLISVLENREQKLGDSLTTSFVPVSQEQACIKTHIDGFYTDIYHLHETDSKIVKSPVDLTSKVKSSIDECINSLIDSKSKVNCVVLEARLEDDVVLKIFVLPVCMPKLVN